jgi:hypothetical protein
MIREDLACAGILSLELPRAPRCTRAGELEPEQPEEIVTDWLERQMILMAFVPGSFRDSAKNGDADERT